MGFLRYKPNSKSSFDNLSELTYPYDQPCARIFAIAILESISNNDFYDRFMDYDLYGDYEFKENAFLWFEQKGPNHTALLPWFNFAKKNSYCEIYLMIKYYTMRAMP